MQTRMIDKQWSEKYPKTGKGPVATEPYISHDYFERERDVIFRNSWVNIGRTEEILKPGDFFVRELEICKTSILVVRGKDGAVRAFHNVCPHRGNTLVFEESGRVPGKFACNFHCWVFNTEGELTGVPDESNFFGLEKTNIELASINCDIWEGFVFVHLGTNPKESLLEYLGGVATQLSGSPFQEMRLFRKYTCIESANWKTGLDAQNELYHLPFQHRYTIGDAFLLKDGKYCRFSNVNLYNYHSVWSCEYNPDHVPLPTEGILRQLDNAKQKIRINQRIGDFDWYCIFPNMALLLFTGASSDWFVTYNFWPLEVDKSIWEIRYYFPPAENVGQRLAQEWSVGQLRDTLMEDAFMHEKIQKGLGSRAISSMTMQDEEIAIRHFHEVYEKKMQKA